MLTRLTRLPAVETIVLGAMLGVFAGVVHVFGLAAPYPTLLQALTVILAGFGVNALTGSAFSNLFNIPQGVLVLVTVGLGTVQMTVVTWGISTFWTATIQGVVTLLLALGFGTGVTPAQARRQEIA